MFDASTCNLIMLQGLSVVIVRKEKVAAFLLDVQQFHDIKKLKSASGTKYYPVPVSLILRHAEERKTREMASLKSYDESPNLGL